MGGGPRRGWRLQGAATSEATATAQASQAVTTSMSGGASDRQASPLAEGDRRLWVIYIKRRTEVQGARTGGGAGIRLGERGEREQETMVAEWDGGRNNVTPAKCRHLIPLGLDRKTPCHTLRANNVRWPW